MKLHTMNLAETRTERNRVAASIKAAALTVAPSSKRFNVSTLTIAYSLRLKLVNPRFGKRLANGV